MNKKKVFISLPMSGLSDDVIRSNIKRARTAYLAVTDMSEDSVKFVDTMDNPDPPASIGDDKQGVWYLGYSLTKLAQCDEAFFWIDWAKARGCRVERDVCDEYGIPVRTLSCVRE